MRASIIITDLTRMQRNRVCVAGVLPSLECVRPISPGTNLHEGWLFQNRPYVLKPFAVIEMELIRPVPDRVAPHIEDWEVDLAYTYCHQLTAFDRYELLHTLTSSHLRSVFGVDISRESSARGAWIQQGTGIRSLGTIHLRRVIDVEFEISPRGKASYRLEFEDEAGDIYHLPVTDLAFRMHLDAMVVQDGLSDGTAAAAVCQRLTQADDVFLRLGLARNWERYPDRCYLQVNGIYSFPDYLDGRCFADFIIEPPEVDVPF